MRLKLSVLPYQKNSFLYVFEVHPFLYLPRAFYLFFLQLSSFVLLKLQENSSLNITTSHVQKTAIAASFQFSVAFYFMYSNSLSYQVFFRYLFPPYELYTL